MSVSQASSTTPVINFLLEAKIVGVCLFVFNTTISRNAATAANFPSKCMTYYSSLTGTQRREKGGKGPERKKSIWDHVVNIRYSKAPCQLSSMLRVSLNVGEKERCPPVLLPKCMLWRKLLSSSCVFAWFTGWNDSIGIAGRVGFNPPNL